MKMEKYDMDDKLVIKSDKDILILVSLFAVALVAIDVLFIPEYIDTPRIGILIYICVVSFILGKIALSGWIGYDRTLIMEKTGCTVCFYCYKKFYTWDEIKVKRWQDYRKIGQISFFGEVHNKMRYAEGVLFSIRPVGKLRWMTPEEFIVYRRPITAFCVNFYPYGIKKGHGDYKSTRGDWTIFTSYRRGPEVYPIEKEIFVNYMKLWEVDIEGLSLDTENIRYVQ